jgi:hypothetical protein
VGKVKKNIAFSKRHKKLGEALETGLKEVSEQLIVETKKNNGYLILSDDKGNIKKVQAKDL